MSNISVAIFFSISSHLYCSFSLAKKKPINEGQFGLEVGWLNHEIIFIFVNLYFLLLYKGKFQFFERFKCEKENWPWEESYSEWISNLKNVLQNVFLNHFIILPLTLILFSLLNPELPHRLDYESLPKANEVLMQYIVVFIVYDFSFYCAHALLNWGPFYSKIHKVHHENKVTFALASEYVHPLEYIFGNLLAFNLGNIILGRRMHFFTNCLFSEMSTLGAIEDHSVYAFPWWPFYLISRYCRIFTKLDFHSFHHLKYKGNYSSAINWDKNLGNTLNPLYEEYRLKQKLE